jgi:ribulose-5-phosphate 4-epimerase/fuculose-1-phosphate aldolase
MTSRARLRGSVLALSCAVFAFSAPASRAQAPARVKASTAVKTDRVVIAELVDANRILASLGILDSYGHVSARSPSHPDHFFLARSIAPGLVTAEDILEFDAEGEPVVPTHVLLYRERYLHAAVYKARRDVDAVDHDHSATVLPFSVTQTPLRAVTHDAAFLGQGVPVFDGDPDDSNPGLQISSMALGAAMTAKLGAGPVLLIRGHGEVVLGASIAEAVSRAVNVEKNCRVELQALALGGPIKFITPAETAGRAKLAASNPEFRDWDDLRRRYGVDSK